MKYLSEQPVSFDSGIHLNRSVIGVLLAFQFASTLMELLSLFILMPVFQYIQAAGDVESLKSQHRLWQILVTAYEAIGLQVGLATLLCTSFSFLMIRQFFVYVRLRYQARARETVVTSARKEGFKRHLLASVDYQDQSNAGGVVNDLTTELQRAIDHLFGRVAFLGLLVVAVIYIICVFALSPPMSATAMVVFAVALIMLRRPMQQAEKVGKEVATANRGMSTFLVERLNHARLVRLAGMEAAEIDQMGRLAKQQRRTLIDIFVLLAKIEIIMEPIVIGAGFLFIFLSVEVLGMRVEQIGLFLVMVLRLLPVIKEAARARQSNRATEYSYNSLSSRFIESAEAEETSSGKRTLNGVSKSLRFDGVHYNYATGENPALRGVNLEFPAGKMTALVGPSGAGKSTILDLIPGMRRPQFGTVEIDGLSISEISLESLRANIAYAPQQAQVFNTTLADHIRYGKPGASEEDIREAASLAGALSFIEDFPEKFATMAGEKGNRLSGGQAQRLDLARALVRRAPILLLDEPTSNLDAQSEEEFRQALDRVREAGKTTIIIIAHRLSTVRNADQIAVVNAGIIEATGTHDTLLTQSAWYRDAFNEQSIASRTKRLA